MNDPKQIQNRAKALLKQKLSKQDVYLLLVDEFNNSQNIAEALRFIPDPVREKRYNWMNYVIILLALSSIVLQLQSPTWEILWPVISIAMVLAKRYQFFFLFILSGSLALFSSFLVLLILFKTNKISSGIDILFYPGFNLVSGIIHILYGLFIPRLFSPAYETYEDETAAKNNDGSSVLKHRFK